jgi:hypothetical protein
MPKPKHRNNIPLAVMTVVVLFVLFMANPWRIEEPGSHHNHTTYRTGVVTMKHGIGDVLVVDEPRSAPTTTTETNAKPLPEPATKTRTELRPEPVPDVILEPATKKDTNPGPEAVPEAGSDSDKKPLSEPVAEPAAETEKSPENPRGYSKLSAIPPDPMQLPVTKEVQTALAEKWGKWKFWDGEEASRPVEVCLPWKR